MKGRIFNIQRFSVHDGPGIRTTVFFKGCNLRCRWCHNPESYEEKIQLEYFPDKCIGCKACEEVCPCGVKLMDGHRVDMQNCILCKKCEEVCMYGAIAVAGKDIEAEQLLSIVKRDKRYYENSGGGITLSGGEPMLQWEFLKEFLPMVKKEGISVALDTAGSIPFWKYEQLLSSIDIVLMDIKLMDEAMHKTYTGVSNHLILENAKKFLEHGIRVHIRIPVIAGINDSIENAKEVKELVKDYPNVEEVRLLPYHTMGLKKAEALGVSAIVFDAPDANKLKALQQVFGKRGIV